jgi:hypothetical protein
MNEEFCFWSFSKWKSVLVETGFRVRENPNNTAESSRVYTNQWIAERRYSGHVELFDSDGAALSCPPTNMILVAEKSSTNLPSAYA